MKRVLLDENIDRRLKRFFDPALEVFTVTEQGWSGLTNGRLLRQASEEFDVLVSMDGNLPHQQNLKTIDLGVVLVKARSNRRDVVEPMMPKINAAIDTIESGQLVMVE